MFGTVIYMQTNMNRIIKPRELISAIIIHYMCAVQDTHIASICPKSINVTRTIMHVKRPKSMYVTYALTCMLSCALSVHVTCWFHAHPLHRVLPFFIVLEAFCKIIMDTFIKNSMTVYVGPSPM